MKKLLSLLLCLMLIFSTVPVFAVPASAATVMSGDYEYMLKDDGTVDITWYCGESATMNIPSTIDSYTVTGIYYNAFVFTDYITAVTIPDTVTYIGESAFEECTALKTVTMGSGITSIGDYAFKNCGSLTTINIPNGVTEIGNGAFLSCTVMTGISIPESVTTIGDAAFQNCEAITTVNFGENLTSIGDYAFYYCHQLTGELVLPDSLTYLGSYAFSDCYNITSITIGKGLDKISNYAFESTFDVSSIVIPDNIKYIGESAFNGSGITSIDFGKGVKEIGANAFAWSELTDVVVPLNVRKVGNGAFRECKNLEFITFMNTACEIYDSEYTIPKTTIIASYAGATAQAYASTYSRTFSFCTVPEDENADKFVFTRENGATIITNYIGGEENVVIPDTINGYVVTKIADNAFNGKQIVNITLNSYITEIGAGAFRYCTKLEKVNITDMDEWYNITFGDCFANPIYYAKNLYLNDQLVTELVVPQGLTGINDFAFYNCTTLKSVVLPEGLTGVGKAAFYYCYSIEELSIPTGFETFGDQSFFYCYKLKDLALPESVSTIGAEAFAYCTGLTEVTLPESVTYLGNGAFDGCAYMESITVSNPECEIYDIESTIYLSTKICGYCDSTAEIYAETYGRTFEETLFRPQYEYTTAGTGRIVITKYLGTDTEVVIPATIDGYTVKAVYNEAFYGNTTVTSVVLPDTAEYVGQKAFAGCTALKSVDLANIDSVGYMAFSGCTALKNLVIPETVTDISSYAFSNCESLTSVTLPKTVTSIGNGAFSSCEALENIFVDDENKVYYDIDGVLCRTYDKSLIQYPNGKKATSYTVPNGITTIGESAFASNLNLMEVTVSADVTTVGFGAFQQCRNLKNATFGYSVAGVGNSAFYNALSLENVYIHNPNCTLYNGVDTIYANAVINAFEGSKAQTYATKYNRIFAPLTTVVEGGVSYTIAGDEAYVSDCDTSLQGNVEVLATVCDYPVTAIGDSAFYDCKGITGVTIPDSITGIGVAAFSNCTTLASITIPDSVTAIGEAAFYFCDNLASVTIGSGVKTIGASAFFHCQDALTEITIPVNVESIGELAFSWCDSLEKITINNPECELFDAENTIPVNATVYGYEGSTAQTYAEAYGCPFVALTEGICGDFAFSLSDGNATITDYLGNDEKVVIPSTVYGFPVTEIGQQVFSGNSTITDVTIPDSIVKMGFLAFNCCDSLKNVYITDLAAWCNIDFYSNESNPLFHGYANLYLNGDLVTELTIPDNVTSISRNAFSGCQSITSLIVPDSVTSIGKSAFRYCFNLTSVEIGGKNGSTTIGENAFSGCTALESVMLNESVTEIGRMAFVDCFNLDSITIKNAECVIESNEQTIPSSITIHGYKDSTAHTYAKNNSNAFVALIDPKFYCGDNAIWSFNAITGVLTISGTGDMYDYNSDPIWTTQYREQITSIVVGDGITRIGNQAFKGLNYVTKADIGDGVKVIGTQAFFGCTKLAEITLNDVLEVIETSGLQDCAFISVTLPSTLTTIGNRAFKQCYKLSQIVIPDSVTSIGYEAFMACNALSNVTFSKNISAIPSLCFSNCVSLKSATLPEQIASIANNAFKGCTAMDFVRIYNKDCSIHSNTTTIPATITIYGYEGSTAESFANTYGNPFESLDSNIVSGTCGDTATWTLDLTTGVLTIGGTGRMYNFTNVGNTAPWKPYFRQIKSVVIGDEITYIGNRSFKGLNYITEAKFGKAVSYTGYEIFYGCTKLAKVTLNQGITTLGALSFYNCTKLTQITIPSSVVNLQNRCFKGSGLTSINVPDTVKTLGYEVFMNCASLASVDYTTGASMLNPRMFENCTSLKTFNFTRNMCRIRSRAFYGCTALESIIFEDANNMWGSSDKSEAKIASNAFEGCNSTLQLIAKDNSHVEEYATRRGFTFVAK